MGGMGASGRLGDVPEAPGIHNETAAFKTKGGQSTRCLQGRLESGPLLAVVRISLQSTCAARGSRSRTSVARITRSTTHARTSSARLPKATWPEQRSRACATARSSTFGRAQTIADLHRAHGVRIISDDTVARFEGTRRVASVVTRRGLRLECDFVVVGIGIEPVVDCWAIAAFTSTTGLSLTSTAAPTSAVSMLQVMSRITTIRSLIGRCEWSTGRTPSSRARRRRAACSASLSPTTRSTGSGLTNMRRICSTPDSSGTKALICAPYTQVRSGRGQTESDDDIPDPRLRGNRLVSPSDVCPPCLDRADRRLRTPGPETCSVPEQPAVSAILRRRQNWCLPTGPRVANRR
jgi:hypothetical protein